MASRTERTDTPIPITGEVAWKRRFHISTGERTEGRRSGHQKSSSTLGSDEEIGMPPPAPPFL